MAAQVQSRGQASPAQRAAPTPRSTCVLSTDSRCMLRGKLSDDVVIILEGRTRLSAAVGRLSRLKLRTFVSPRVREPKRLSAAVRRAPRNIQRPSSRPGEPRLFGVPSRRDSRCDSRCCHPVAFVFGQHNARSPAWTAGPAPAAR